MHEDDPDEEDVNTVELSTVQDRLVTLPNYEPLPKPKKSDPATIARRKRAKAARKKNR